MSDELRAAQAKLVASLLDDRVPDGFEAKGIHATAAVLRRKRRTRDRATERSRFVRVIDRLKEWWRSRG
jgi:hypothetical protein